MDLSSLVLAGMPADQFMLLLILLISTVLYVGQWWSVEVVSLLTIVALLVTGVLSPADALSGFSSSATITVAAMFVLSAGIMRTGALDSLSATLARYSNGQTWRLLALVAVVVPTASAFINNTPIVVLMIPVMLSLARRLSVAPSKLLMPVAFLASLGGTLSLLGTSTNILVDSIYRDLGGPGFHLFSFTAMGVLYCGVGALYIVITSRWLLPDRAPLADLASRHGDSVYITEVKVGSDSAVLGRTIEQVFSRIARQEKLPAVSRSGSHRRLTKPRRLTDTFEQKSAGVELLELVRVGRIYRAEETRGLTLAAGDTLLVSGSPSEIAALLRSARTTLATVLEDGQRAPVRLLEQQVIEAVVLPTSSVDGRLVGELGLHHLYGVGIMGAQRYGRQQFEGLRSMRLAVGDMLLLQGSQNNLHAACEANGLLVVEGVEHSIARGGKRTQALLIMLTVVILASFTPLPIVTLALSGALAMVLSGCLRPGEALSSLDSTSLLLLAGTIPLGAAMEQSGLAQRMVDITVGAIGVENPWIFVSLFFFVTWILTELLSNNAVAVLMTPIALTLARTTGINPMALLMVVVFGASASFTLPQGYQTNIMVMGPGGYRFVDYLRFGLPLSLLCWLTASVLIPIFWPLMP